MIQNATKAIKIDFLHLTLLPYYFRRIGCLQKIKELMEGFE